MQKVNFLIPHTNEYLDGKRLERVSLDDHSFFINSQRAWIVQTYLHLRKLTSSIVFSNTLLPDAINVLHCDEMLKNPHIGKYFTVSIVADRRVYLGGDLNIVQNRDQVFISKDHWIMHWPQTNLIPSIRTGREPKFRVGFLGLEKNSINLKEIINTSKYNENIDVIFRGPGKWHDYSDLDAVIAIRDFTSSHSQKPPTKLVNAWSAGVVFIGGNDSAYEQIGTPGRDYIKCSSPRDLVFQLERLIDEPEVRTEMIAAGKKSVTSYTSESVAMQWLNFFETLAKPEFERWNKGSIFRRKSFMLYRYFIYTILRIKRFAKIKVGMY
ncbi:MAG: glycosyltransferase [Pseudomonadota bacterium]